MVFTTLAQVLAGIGLPLWLARRAARRREAAPVLLLSGALARVGMLILGPLLEGLVALLIASSRAGVGLMVFAGVVGFLRGAAAAGLVTALIVRLAPPLRVDGRSLLLVGVGYGGTQVIIRAAGVGLVLLANMQLGGMLPGGGTVPPEQQAALDAYLATPPLLPLLDTLIVPGMLLGGLASVWLVGRMFRTGSVGWFFAALWWEAVIAVGVLLFRGQGAVLWWSVIGAVGLVLLWRDRSALAGEPVTS